MVRGKRRIRKRKREKVNKAFEKALAKASNRSQCRTNKLPRRKMPRVLFSSDGPRFRYPPTSVQSHYGAAEILQCDVDGNPQPEIYWTHEDSERILATASNISVLVRPETAGRYYCHARVPGFPELTGSANIYIRAPPTIISQRTQYVPDEGLVKVRLEPTSRIYGSALSFGRNY
ncbi:PREDICTED: irregular chiasm C-roughest protein-like [Ceratosolen solmsi marchali]|uniref:Irregular chiasm C-roughest protein-like n=1 Tax=Ceratosolen solmsi marchali TaxID=326594 RepID=A0AAJ6YFU9_9HYME|nr:PREDICTED: irregular chiasm C-roughest protein-like [Ceratosolen solmsi marchali]